MQSITLSKTFSNVTERGTDIAQWHIILLTDASDSESSTGEQTIIEEWRRFL